jgi:hypothetical protein
VSVDKLKQKHVAEVTLVRVWLQESQPPLLVVEYKGLVSTTGWSQPELWPRFYTEPPADGIYDFDFMALPPDGPSSDQIYEIGDEVSMAGAPHDIVGIRVHAANNSLLAKISDSSPANLPTGEIRVAGDGSIPWL